MLFPVRTFRRYLTFAVTLTVAVPIFVLGIAEHLSVNRLIASIEKERRDTAQLISDSLNREVREAQALVRLLAGRIEESPSDEAGLRSFVGRMQNEFPDFLNIHIDDPTGTCLIFVSSEASSISQEGLSHSQRWHMKEQRVLAGHHISGAFQGEGATNRWIVSLTSAAFDKTGTPLGYACAALNLTEVARRSLINVPESFAVTMTDSKGRIIWSNETGRTTGDLITEDSSPVRYGKTGIVNPETGWHVSVGSPAHELARNDSIIIAGLVMLLTLILTCFAGSAFAKPLAEAVESLADEISGRQRIIRTSRQLPAELQRLREAWLRAVAARETAQRRLETLNEGLEKTVQERTAGIEAQKSLLDALIRSLYDGVILYDDAEVAAVVNLQAQSLTGLNEGEWVFQKLNALIPDLTSRTLPPDGRRFSARSGKMLEIVPFEVPHSLHGKPGHGLILRDVTEIATLDALRAALVSVVAHEMKTPLAALKLQTSVLTQIPALQSSSESELLADIAESTGALEQLINDWLDWSRIENRTLSVTPRLIRLDAVIAKAAKAVKIRCPDLRIVLEQPNGPVLAFADPDRLRQVFSNLLTNAYRYRNEADPEIRFRMTANDGIVRITAADNGIGITPEKAERIFDCFYQIDMGTTRRAGGTGLGLAICRGIMNALHGTIRVIYPHEHTKGSVFELTLPARPPLATLSQDSDS